jgi:hypothetical protein
MRRLTAFAVVLLALPLALPASEFDWMVREFSRQSGVRPVHIPLFGVVRFAVAVTRPAGTSGLKLAVFEHPNMQPGDFTRAADSMIGNSWKQIIRVRSKDGEFTNIYLQPDGKHLKLLIAALDKDDATFVEVRIKPQALIRWVDDRKHSRR